MEEKSGYFIVGDYDRPCEELLAMQIENVIHYIHPDTKMTMVVDEGYARHNLTPVEDFGVVVIKYEGQILGLMVGPSVAKYSWGDPREWQGSRKFAFPIKLRGM